jgi:TusA-related sulfurtransferase
VDNPSSIPNLPISSPADIVLDMGDTGCDQLLEEIEHIMQTMNDGQTILVTAYDPAAPLDIKAWCGRTGNTLVTMSLADNRFLLRKGK